MIASPAFRRTISTRPALVAVSLMAALLLLQLALPAGASPPDGMIKGYVEDGPSGSPISGTFVRIESEAYPWFVELSTSPTGYYEASLPPGRYSVIVLDPDHNFFAGSAGVGTAQTTWLNISLNPALPRTGVLKGNVTDIGSGFGVSGRVVAMPDIGGPMPEGYINVSVTDPFTGYYEMELLTGAYRVFTDSAYGYVPADVFPVNVSPGDNWLDFMLTPNPIDALIEGTVYDVMTLAPVAGADVFVEIDELLFTGIADAIGNYSVLVPSGFAAVTADAPGYAPGTDYTVTFPASISYLDVYVRPINSMFVGYVTDAMSGAPVVGARVAAQEPSPGYYDHAPTNDTGYYALPVPEGAFDLEASAPGYAGWSSGFAFFIFDGETLWINITLWPIVSTVQGYLLDASDGSRIPGLFVGVFDFFFGFSNFTTSNDTGFYEVGTPESSSLAVVVPGQAGYAGGFMIVSTQAGEVTWANVTVYPLNAVVRVIVTDFLTGAPVPGAFVDLMWLGFYSVTNVTDGNGTADLDSPATTDVSLSVFAPGYYSFFDTISPVAGLNIISVVLYPVLPEDVLVKGYITDATSSLGIPGAFVEATGYDGVVSTNSTNATGYYELYVVAYPQTITASAFGYASNSSTVSGTSGETIWLNLTLLFDPDPPEFVSFTATPVFSVSLSNPTTIEAEILELSLDMATMNLLRQVSVADGNGTFISIGEVPSGDLTVSETSPGTYSVSTVWNATASGGRIYNATLSEWWPALPTGFLPGTYGVFGMWANATVAPGGALAVFDMTTGDLLFVFTGFGPVSAASQPDSWFTPAASALVVNLTTGMIIGGTLATGNNYTLGSLRFAFDDVVPSGTYGAFLQLWDSAGNYNESVVLFGVDNTAPAADADGPYSVVEDRALTFDGTASSDNEGVVSYVWTFTDGTPRTLTGATPSYTFTSPGTYDVTLTVTDAAGNVDVDVTTVVVDPDAAAPTANAGADQAVDEDTLVTFDGSGSGDDGVIASYAWTFTDGTPRTLTGVGPTYTFATPGVYTVTLTVTDGGGNTDTDTMTVTVADVTAPTANAGVDQTVDEDATVTFDGAGSSDNVAVVNYTWTFTDGGAVNLYGVGPSYVFAEPGSYVVTLTVRDATGRSATDSMTVTVRDVTDPTASITAPAANATVSGVITITVTASDNVGVVEVELWVDGTFEESDVTAPYSFSLDTRNLTDGAHTLRIVVNDAAGNSVALTRTVTVANASPPGPGLDIVAYGSIGLILVAAAIAAAFFLMRRRRPKVPEETMPPAEEPVPPSTTAPAETPSGTGELEEL